MEVFDFDSDDSRDDLPGGGGRRDGPGGRPPGRSGTAAAESEAPAPAPDRARARRVGARGKRRLGQGARAEPTNSASESGRAAGAGDSLSDGGDPADGGAAAAGTGGGASNGGTGATASTSAGGSAATAMPTPSTNPPEKTAAAAAAAAAVVASKLKLSGRTKTRRRMRVPAAVAEPSTSTSAAGSGRPPRAPPRPQASSTSSSSFSSSSSSSARARARPAFTFAAPDRRRRRGAAAEKESEEEKIYPDSEPSEAEPVAARRGEEGKKGGPRRCPDGEAAAEADAEATGTAARGNGTGIGVDVGVSEGKGEIRTDADGHASNYHPASDAGSAAPVGQRIAASTSASPLGTPGSVGSGASASVSAGSTPVWMRGGGRRTKTSRLRLKKKKDEEERNSPKTPPTPEEGWEHISRVKIGQEKRLSSPLILSKEWDTPTKKGRKKMKVRGERPVCGIGTEQQKRGEGVNGKDKGGKRSVPSSEAEKERKRTKGGSPTAAPRPPSALPLPSPWKKALLSHAASKNGPVTNDEGVGGKDAEAGAADEEVYDGDDNYFAEKGSENERTDAALLHGSPAPSVGTPSILRIGGSGGGREKRQRCDRNGSVRFSPPQLAVTVPAVGEGECIEPSPLNTFGLPSSPQRVGWGGRSDGGPIAPPESLVPPPAGRGLEGEDDDGAPPCPRTAGKRAYAEREGRRQGGGVFVRRFEGQDGR